MKEKNIKNGKAPYWFLTKTPAEINKVIDKLKDTSEWKSAVGTFTAKAMKVILKL
jgi:hypothetical protein